jgi:hypothetical protein
MEVCALVYGAPTPKSLAASAVRSDAIGPKRHLVRRNEIPLPGEKRARNRWLRSVAFDPVIEAMPCESDPAPSASGPLCPSTSDIELSRYGNGIIASDAEAVV